MQVKSEYVKKKIKGRSFSKEKDRNYIHDLLNLERYVLKGPSGTADAMMLSGLEGEYPKEYVAIFKELDPEGYEAHLENERREKEKNRKLSEKLQREEDREYERERKQWLALGGKE